jgi:hypothetical protein
VVLNRECTAEQRHEFGYCAYARGENQTSGKVRTGERILNDEVAARIEGMTILLIKFSKSRPNKRKSYTLVARCKHQVGLRLVRSKVGYMQGGDS